MNNRRSFLKMLGLSAVAAPAVATLAVEAEAAPVAAWPPTNSEYLRGRDILKAQRRGAIELQREINRLHSAQLAAIDDHGYRVWIDWAKRATS